MKESISIHRYSLHSRAALNTKSDRHTHHGALIRVGDGDYGYGCIHPWPELGDLNLENTINLLTEGKHTALSRRALLCAHSDAEARREKRNLFEGLTIPQSHATLMMDEADFQTAVEAGFKMAKVKVGRDFDSEIEFIRAQSSRFQSLEWRLDFNGSQSLESVKDFLHALGEETRDKIDFIEDAYLLNSSPWVNALGPYDIPMAVDREVTDACGGFGVAVIKPALNTPAPILERAVDESKRVVFTSYMDHPLGQCFAAWQAALANQSNQSNPEIISTCGLVTHGLFEPDPFTEALGEPGPEFHPATGTGLGFDELLKSLKWTPLN